MIHKFLLFNTLFSLLLISCNSSYKQNENLFSEKNVGLWKPMGDSRGFAFKNDMLLCSGQEGQFNFDPGKTWKNFELTAEVNTSPGSCASLVFHLRDHSQDGSSPAYEVLVSNSCKMMNGKRFLPRTGSLLAVRNVYFPTARDGEWFTLQISVKENHIETFVNGVKVVDYIQPEKPWRGAGNENRVVGNGTFAVRQYTGETTVKSVTVRPIPNRAKTSLAVDQVWDTKITRLMENGFPLVDFHVHLKGGLTVDQAIANSQRLGINYGIAPNCGLKFPVTNDATLVAYMDTVRSKPIFRGMQAEGREWITLFSPEAIAKFDYVFTDALTFTDAGQRRTRLWIPEEVWIDDKQAFMDQLVGKIEAIFSQEPVDIYVNPTLLPASLMPEYDQLWTPERMERVIRVLAANNITLEINARYKVPHAEFVRLAKEAGMKFSFGTNNAKADLGQLEYCFEIMEQFGLTPDDMFIPKEQSEKPVLVKGLPAHITG